MDAISFGLPFDPIDELIRPLIAIKTAIRWLRPRMALTGFLNVTRYEPVMEASLVRQQFTRTPISSSKPVMNHTHGLAASERAGATLFMERVASELGLTPNFVQRSRADVKAGREGSREHYWVKDLQVDPSPCNPPDHSMLCLVDVDQYLDMPGFLAKHFKPTMIYTFQPSAVSRVATNYSFTFKSDNRVDYTVTGGAQYCHKVWNYSNDNLKIVTYHLLPPFVRAVSYLVDRRSMAPDHELIMLTPMGRWRNLSAWLFNRYLAGSQLNYLNVVQSGDFTRMMVKSREGVMISTGRVGEYLCTTISARADNAIAGIARTSKYDLSFPQVQAFVHGEKEESVQVYAFHRANVAAKLDQVCPVPSGVRAYQYKPMTYQSDAKAPLQPYMQPLMHGAFCPARTKANEEMCVQERVTAVQPDELQMTPFLHRAMKDFVRFLIPVPNRMFPTDHEEVLDRQARPSQRRLYWMSAGLDPKRLISMFIKSEAYPNIKPPRPISTINTVDKVEYSRYIYSLEQLLKACPWYAFGLTPRRISQRVVQVLTNAKTATPTDFSKFDGHGSNLMRTLERMVLTRAFETRYHTKIIELHDGQFNLSAYGKFGTWYESGFSRASGSPETSLFNTIFNAFIAFYAQVLQRRTPAEAWEGLGIYGGDDGLTADVEPKYYLSAAQQMGQALTYSVIKRGDPGIVFLARVYSPEVWYGELSNCCDLPRQLSKLHVTVTLPSCVTPVQKFLEKIRAYSLTDPYTPIIGELAKRAVQLTDGIPLAENKHLDPMKTWLSKFEMHLQYENKPADWMDAYVARALPEFNITRFREWLQKCGTINDMLLSPMFTPPVEPESKIPVVIDGVVYPLNAIVREIVPPRLPHVAKMRDFVRRGWAVPDEWIEIIRMSDAEEADLAVPHADKKVRVDDDDIPNELIPEPIEQGIPQVQLPDFVTDTPVIDIKFGTGPKAIDSGPKLHNQPCLSDKDGHKTDTKTSYSKCSTKKTTTTSKAAGPARPAAQEASKKKKQGWKRL
jgi:hypothetical protein